jgi:GNAT superfamily N-acetyltransferase
MLASAPKAVLLLTEDLMLVDLEPNDSRWESALPVLQELRPHLTLQLLEQVLQEGGSQGLRFTALFKQGRCVAIAGWRVIANTSAIRKLYVDDLSTAASERSSGHGAALLSALMDRGRELGCHQIDLDSGVQRHAAHRFYLRERMDISSYHFSRRLN